MMMMMTTVTTMMMMMNAQGIVCDLWKLGRGNRSKNYQVLSLCSDDANDRMPNDIKHIWRISLYVSLCLSLFIFTYHGIGFVLLTGASVWRSESARFLIGHDPILINAQLRAQTSTRKGTGAHESGKKRKQIKQTNKHWKGLLRIRTWATVCSLRSSLENGKWEELVCVRNVVEGTSNRFWMTLGHAQKREEMVLKGHRSD
jgi:hypothetical protein